MSQRRNATAGDPSGATLALPYKSLDVVLNSQNLWGYRLDNCDPAVRRPQCACLTGPDAVWQRVLFDLDDETRWSPFISVRAPSVRDSGGSLLTGHQGGFAYTCKPFYTPRRLAPPQPEGRCEMLATEIYREIIGLCSAARVV
jgi:hypothetical protein